MAAVEETLTLKGGGVMTLAEEWAILRMMVLRGKDDVEMQRSFYAGAMAVIHNLHKIAGDDVSDEAAVKVIQDMNQEAAQFFLDLLKSEAAKVAG